MRGRMNHGTALLASSLLSLALAGAAGATGLQVAPTTLNLGPAQNADGLWLTNTSAEALHAQARVYEWTQSGGEDHLEPSRALAISPPMLQLAPGARQLVRVIRVGAPPARAEAAYRIIVDELPVDEPAADAKAPPPASAATQLKFVLRYSIPVFVTAEGQSGPDLHGTLVERDGETALELRNDGGTHAQLGNLALESRGRRSELVPGLVGYVLPGSTMRWPVKIPAGTQDAQLQSRINGDAVERVVAAIGARP
ncbi:fimbrial chaperone protein [Dokdonella fugitiva]|uniref:Fimbrial chaperone protein n=2 Tax=Dokdonella fugitiva TaxID=328517 RepID=A0A4R2IKM2_9GAMM|nr:fimbrial chaperone protein [Dokdonella fugitiva]